MNRETAERVMTLAVLLVSVARPQVQRKQPKVPAQVLVNAYHDGLFDRGGKGSYKLNSVGENLVAMALPGTNDTAKGSRIATRSDSGAALSPFRCFVIGSRHQ